MVFDGTAFRKWRASEVVGEVRRARKGSRSLLIAWDAPMSFSPARGFSDRAVDKGTRGWLKEAFGASCGVNALPFSQCPHWAITSAALGVPTGDGFASRVVRPVATLTGTFAIEVHPAVTLAWWWFTADKARKAPPAYKRGSTAARSESLRALVEGLGHLGIAMPEECRRDDDHLDAWVAWKMVRDFLDGGAGWIGDSEAGGYVVPLAAVGVLSAHVEAADRSWGKG